MADLLLDVPFCTLNMSYLILKMAFLYLVKPVFSSSLVRNQATAKIEPKAYSGEISLVLPS